MGGVTNGPTTPDVTIWDISDPTDPNKVGEITSSTATVHNLYIIGDRMYVSWYADGVKIYDVSDPVNPILLDEYDTSPNATEGFFGAFGIYPFAPSGNLYVSDIQAGLMIFGDPISTSIESVDQDQFVRLFPNPAREELRVQFDVPQASNLQIRILDVVGREVLPIQKLSFPSGRSNHSLDINVLPAGIYTLNLQGAINKSLKFIRQ
ncbi:MAG: T9SS type A sorting domain-containing protein [Bacteroidota bacterium]